METYLTKILEKNGRVILPEFGAFIVKQQKPLTIVFNEFLQYNDGILHAEIAAAEGISSEAAKEKVDSYIAEITKKLNNGDTFVIEKFGVLYKSTTGKISLEDSSKLPSSVETKTYEEEISLDTSIEPLATESRKTGEELNSSANIETEIDSSTTEEKIKEHQMEAVEKAKPLVAESEVTAAPEVELRKELDEIQAKEKNQTQQIKKRKKSILIWILIILLVDGGIVAYFLFSENLESVFQKKSVPIENSVLESMPAEEIAEQSFESIPEEVAEAELLEQAVVQTIQEKADESHQVRELKYYIVAGAFRDEQNADNLVKELKAKGYKAEKFARLDNLFHVSYASFVSKPEADKMLVKIQKDFDPAAWIKALEK